MVVEMCLTALLSGILETDGNAVNMDKVMDKETKIVYLMDKRPLYVLPDKYNMLKLCNKKERFPVSASDGDKFNLIKE